MSLPVSAVSYLLNRIGLHTSLRILRQNVVEYLRRNPTNNFPTFGVICRQTLANLPPRDGTYGNQVTLLAISVICTIQICVLSALGIVAEVDI